MIAAEIRTHSESQRADEMFQVAYTNGIRLNANVLVTTPLGRVFPFFFSAQDHPP